MIDSIFIRVYSISQHTDRVSIEKYEVIRRNVRYIASYVTLISYIILSPILVLVEEVMVAYKQYQNFCQIIQLSTIITTEKVIMKRTIKIMTIDTSKKFSEITLAEQEAYITYFNAVSYLLSKRLMVMARESSTQFCLQTAVLIYEYFYPPLYELDYQSWSSPTAVWTLLLFVRILSIALSAYSTFAPILDYTKLKNFKQHQMPPRLTKYVIKVLETVLHIALATLSVYLKRLSIIVLSVVSIVPYLRYCYLLWIYKTNQL